MENNKKNSTLVVKITWKLCSRCENNAETLFYKCENIKKILKKICPRWKITKNTSALVVKITWKLCSRCENNAETLFYKCENVHYRKIK